MFISWTLNPSQKESPGQGFLRQLYGKYRDRLNQSLAQLVAFDLLVNWRPPLSPDLIPKYSTLDNFDLAAVSYSPTDISDDWAKGIIEATESLIESKLLVDLGIFRTLTTS